MTRTQMLMELEDIGLLLNSTNVEGEKNLNNLLCAIQKTRRLKNAIEEEQEEKA